jgi:hypothetical protein
MTRVGVGGCSASGGMTRVGVCRGLRLTTRSDVPRMVAARRSRGAGSRVIRVLDARGIGCATHVVACMGILACDCR